MRTPLPQCLDFGELLGIMPLAVIFFPTPTKGIEGLDKNHPTPSISLQHPLPESISFPLSFRGQRYRE